MFIDKNGVELHIGDYIAPDEGLELLITEERYEDMFGEDCLIATQVLYPDVYSILPQDNLSTRWSKIDAPSQVRTTSSSITEEKQENGGDYEPADPAPSIMSEEEARKYKEIGTVYG